MRNRITEPGPSSNRTLSPAPNNSIPNSTGLPPSNDPSSTLDVSRSMWDEPQNYSSVTSEVVEGFLDKLKEFARFIPTLQETASDLLYFKDLSYQLIQYWEVEGYYSILDVVKSYADTGKVSLDSLDLSLLTDLVNGLHWDSFQQWLRRPYKASDTPHHHRVYRPSLAQDDMHFPPLTVDQMMRDLDKFMNRYRLYSGAEAKGEVSALSPDTSSTPMAPEVLDMTQLHLDDEWDGPDTHDWGEEANWLEEQREMYPFTVTTTGHYKHPGGGRRMLMTGGAASSSTTFQPVTIGLVVHAMQYAIPPSNTTGPKALHHQPEAALKRLVDITNIFMWGTGVSLTVAEFRTDIRKYPYLLLDSREDWQELYMTANSEGRAKMEDIAEEHNANVTQYVNVYIVGDFNSPECDYKEKIEEGQFQCPAGLTHLPPEEPDDPGAGSHHLVLLAIQILDEWNSEQWFEDGASILTHEMGHYLGLEHTFAEATAVKEACGGSGDYVGDTPPHIQEPRYLKEAGHFCIKYWKGHRPDPSVLNKFKTCRRAPQPDHIFNIMSYNAFCATTFTPGQIHRLRTMMMQGRPKLYVFSLKG